MEGGGMRHEWMNKDYRAGGRREKKMKVAEMEESEVRNRVIPAAQFSTAVCDTHHSLTSLPALSFTGDAPNSNISSM